MKRKISLFLTILIILTLITGCKKANKTNVEISSSNKEAVESGEEKEITIMMSRHNTMNMNKIYNRQGMTLLEIDSYMKQLSLVRMDYTNKTGVKVNIEHTRANNYDEYLQNRNAQFYLEDGPELILISGGEDYQNLIREGIALEVNEKLSNYKNIYDSLKDGYFVPMSMAVDTVFLNERGLNELNIDKPKSNWGEEDFESIIDAFNQNGNTFITPEVIYLMINSKLGDSSIYLNNKGEINISNEEMIKAIEDIRYQLLESNRFKQREDYTYENYYNMMYKPITALGYYDLNKEEKDYIDTWGTDFGIHPYILPWGSTNCLNALATNNNKEKYAQRNNFDVNFYQGESFVPVTHEETILLPRPYPTYSSWGFIVNRNGKNIEEALEFLDMLLSDEAQLKVYTNLDDKHHAQKLISFSTPIVETIEDEILDIDNREGVDKELIEMRLEILKQIKEGIRTRNYRGSSFKGAYKINVKEQLTEEQERFLKEELEAVIIKVVFSDERYSSEKIMMELRELENRLNLIFSE